MSPNSPTGQYARLRSMARFSFPSSGASSSGGRGRNEAWFRLGTVDVTTTLLIIGLGAISIVLWAIAPDAMAQLRLDPSAVRSGQVWRILTWPLYNEPNLWAVLALVFFYFFGRELERLMGRTRFLWYCLMLTVVPGIAATALDIEAAGLATIQLACFLAYVVIYPQARSFFNIPLWVLGAVLLGIEVLQLVGMRMYGALLLLFISCAAAVLTLSAFGLTGSIPWLKAPRPRRRSGRKLHAVADPPPSVFRPPAAPRSGERLHQADIDMLLDKIAAEGIDSLTPEERRRLDEASRRLRDDKP